MKKMQTLIDKMYDGDTEAIVSGISSKNDYILINSVLAGTKYGIKDKRFIDGVLKAQNSKSVLLGFSLASIAIASEHFLTNKRYMGDDTTVKALIESKFNI